MHDHVYEVWHVSFVKFSKSHTSAMTKPETLHVSDTTDQSKLFILHKSTFW